MGKRINVAELAMDIQKDTNKLLETEISKLIKKSEEENMSNQEAIALSAVTFKTNTEVFIVALLQKVVDELQENNQ